MSDDELKSLGDACLRKEEPKPLAWRWRAFNGFDAKVDRAVELGVEDFEKKCDAIARTFSTVMFTCCFAVIIFVVALKWASS